MAFQTTFLKQAVLHSSLVPIKQENCDDHDSIDDIFTSLPSGSNLHLDPKKSIIFSGLKILQNITTPPMRT